MSNQMILILIAVSSVASYCGMRMYLRFALNRQLFDVPNERSSHTIPTPRGGGVAFVAVFSVAVGILSVAHMLVPQESIALLAGMLVAAIGYWDDRHEVSLRTRLIVQVLSACIAVAAVTTLHLPGQASTSVLVIAILLVIEVLGLAWLLNLTNFMDGIDGIVAIEILSVAAACTVLIVLKSGIAAPAVLFALLGAIIVPFLLFNWSPAIMFMGDVGSGYLGFMVGVLTLVAVARHQLFLLSPVILLGVFLSDATTTLITRMLRREQWYAPHRSHAYQICARHYGHKRVVTCVGIINLVWLTPLAVAAQYDSQHGIFYVLIALTPLAVASYLIRAEERRAEIGALPTSSSNTPQMGLSLSTTEHNQCSRRKALGALLDRYSSLCQLIAIAIVTLGASLEQSC